MKPDFDILFSSVTKIFREGTFFDVLGSLFGREAKLDGYRALSDISFSVQPGELLGVLGRNGAGKSTLLRVAGGMYHPDSGKVVVRVNPTALIEMGMYSNEHLTGRQFCRVYLSFRNVSKKNFSKLIDDIHDFSELDEYFDEPIHTYSAGMGARLMFGAITAVPAEIVLLDEILSVGDQHFQGKSFRRLMGMINKGASGIFATHDWFTATRLCSNIMILNKGEVEFSGPATETVRRYLDLAPSLTHKVRILDKETLSQAAQSVTPGRPFYFKFKVDSTIDSPFVVGLALEIPRLALVVVLSNDHIIKSGIGTYCIEIMMHAFPIGYPESYLSLFVSAPRLPGEGSAPEGYDQMSWTSGESIKLISMNRNEYDSGVVHRQLSWRRTG